MSDAARHYSVHEGDATRDRDVMLAIWHGTLGHDARMAAKYDWFYLRCPAGAPLLRLLRHDPDGDSDPNPNESWAGACTLGRRRMRLHGRDIRAGLQVDFAVLAAHRSLGPALALQQALLASAGSQFDLVYGFPNRKAVAIFKRLGWKNIIDLVRYTRVLRHGAYLQRNLPDIAAKPLGFLLDALHRVRDRVRHRFPRHYNLAWSDRVDPRMDALWASSRHGDALASVRDADYLHWRFDDCPLAKTRYLLLSSRAGNDLVAWFATQVDGNTLLVRDCWSTDGTHGIDGCHVDALVSAAHAAGHAAVSVEIGAEASRVAGWRSRGFVARGHRPMYGSLPGRECENITAYVTAADEDE